MVTLYVGPKEIPYVVDKYKLSNSCDFFKKCLQGFWKEGRESAITLPDEKPEVFDSFLSWLYNGGTMTSSIESHSFLSYLQLYTLGDKWLGENLKRASWKGLCDTHLKLDSYSALPSYWEAVQDSVIRFFVCGKYIELSQKAYEVQPGRTFAPVIRQSAEFLYDVILCRQVLLKLKKRSFNEEWSKVGPKTLKDFLLQFGPIA